MSQVPLWVTLAGIAVSLAGISGSAIAYVIRLYQEDKGRRRAQFFELMQFLDANGTIAAKCAAAYQLREYKEHAAFIVRFCESQRSNITGEAASILRDELDRTREAMLRLHNAHDS